MPIFNPTATNTTCTPIMIPLHLCTVNQGTWAYNADTCWAYEWWYNSSSANGDSVTYSFYAPAGTYTLNALYSTRNSAGIIKFNIDGSVVKTLDCYAAGSTANNSSSTTGITLGSGIHSMIMYVDGKNGASSNYICPINGVFLNRTA